MDFLGAGDPLEPGGTATFTYQMKAPLTLDTDKDIPLAWNSFAHRATFSTGSELTTEPIKVGVGMLFGTLKVGKKIDGLPPDITLGDFEFGYECSITPAGGDAIVVDSGTVAIKEGETKTLPFQPAGAVCKVWETDSQGVDSPNIGEENAQEVTIESNIDNPQGITVTIENKFNTGELELKKTVTGGAADLPTVGGGTVGDSEFPILVDCEFQDQQLPDFPQVIELADSETHKITGIPANSVCFVDEFLTWHADVSISVNGGDPIIAGDEIVIIDSTEDGGTEVAFTNDYPANGLVINKTISGSGGDWTQGPYEFEVNCVLGLSRLDQILLEEIDAEITVDDPTATVDPLPVGARCLVYETNNGNADGETPRLIDTVIITEEGTDPVTVDADNVYSSGNVSIGKTVSGDAADQAVGVEFKLRVQCERDLIAGGTETILDETVTLNGGESHTFSEDLPIGARCWATETDTGGASNVVIDYDSASNSIEITHDSPNVEILATNRYDDAALVVKKQMSGEFSGGRGPFRFKVSCKVDGQNLVLPEEDRKFTLAAGQTKTINVAKGAICTVTETHDDGADYTDIVDTDKTSGGNKSNGIVQLDQKQTVTFMNVFDGSSGSGSGSGLGEGGANPSGTGGYSMAATWSALLLIVLGLSLMRSARRFGLRKP